MAFLIKTLHPGQGEPEEGFHGAKFFGNSLEKRDRKSVVETKLEQGREEMLSLGRLFIVRVMMTTIAYSTLMIL